ncbi:MAG: protein kinase [Planctomycetota bacterium]
MDTAPIRTSPSSSGISYESLWATIPTPEPISRLGDYRILRELGTGGMGAVYLAEDAAGRRVALKVPHLDDPADRERFEREGQLLQQIQHPNVVRVVDRGELDGRPFLAMELVVGSDLETVLGRRVERRLSLPEAVHVLSGCCAALQALHAQGIVHRDVKPANLILTPDGQIKLVDFGLAFREAASVRLTASNEVLGTPQYLPPETARGGGWSPAGDLYSLGVLAFRVLYGKLPFDHDDVIQTVVAHVKEPAPQLTELLPDLPRELTELVDGLLEKDPLERPKLSTFRDQLDLHPAEAADLEPLFSQIEAKQQPAAVTPTRPLPLLQPGQRFHHYLIEGELGRGGMGVVYLAHHERLRRRVALKVLRSGSSASERERIRFVTEGRAAAVLKHPNVVEVLDAGEHEGMPYLAMAHVEGLTLGEILDARDPARDDVRPVLEVLRGICRGVSHAHERGVVHRDLKPDNVIVDDAGVPRVFDFGLAKLDEGEDADALTRTGDVVGTLLYMSPEQAAGRISEVDARSDVYSLGAILFEALTGRPPFTGTQRDLYVQLADHDPPTPSSLQPRVPWELDAICLRCLAKDPEERYLDAAALADDLDAFCEGRSIQARPAGPVRRLRGWIRRNRVPAAAAAAAVGMLSIVGLGYAISAQARRARLTERVAEGWQQYSDARYVDAERTFQEVRAELGDDEVLTLPESTSAQAAQVVSVRLEQADATDLGAWSTFAARAQERALADAQLDAAARALDAGDFDRASAKLIAAAAVFPEEHAIERLTGEAERRLHAALDRALAESRVGGVQALAQREEAYDRASHLLQLVLRIAPESETTAEAEDALERAHAALTQARVDAAAEPHIRVSALPADGVLADGSDQARIEVVVRDPEGRPRAGAVVRVTASRPGVEVQQPLTPTDGTGYAVAWVRATVADLTTFTVTIDPGEGEHVLARQPTVQFRPGLPDPDLCRFELPAAVRAGEPQPLEVWVRDRCGNPVPGARLVLSTDAEGVSLSQPEPADAEGRLVAQLEAARTGSLRLRCAFLDGAREAAVWASPLISVVAGQPDLAASRIECTGAATADGATSVGVEVRLVDAAGNPCPRVPVRLDVEGEGASLEPRDALSDEDGVVHARLKTRVAGELRLQADLGGGRVLSSERSVSFAPGAPDPHACSVEPVRQGRAAADGEPLPLVVFVRDSQGNAVPGVRVQLLCAATGVTLHQPRLPSDPEGKVQAAVSATLAQRAEVEVKLLGLGQALPAPLSLEFTAPERAGP